MIDPTKYGAKLVTQQDPTKYGARLVTTREQRPDESNDGYSFRNLDEPFYKLKTQDGSTKSLNLESGIGIAGNIGKSLVKFGRDTANFFNPFNTGKSIWSTAGNAIGYTKDKIAEVESLQKAAELEAKVKQSIGKSPVAKPYQAPNLSTWTVAKALGKSLSSPAVENISKGQFTNALQSVAEDPYQLAPYFLTAKGALENTKLGQTKAGQAFDKAMSATAKPVIKTAESVKSGITSTARFGTSQATGMNPETIKTVIESPGEFSRSKINSADRIGLAEQVNSVISKRLADLTETGKGYNSIRTSAQKVTVEPGWIGKSLERQGWSDGALAVDASGQARPGIKPTKLANISNAEQAALNKFMDVWGSKKTLTAEEFLDGRKFLDTWSKWQSEVQATDQGKALFREIRHDFNKYGQSDTSGIKGLKSLDETYGSEASQLREIQKEYLNRDGSLKDNASSKIANLTNKGKEQALARLERLMPGVTKQIKVLRAIEDIHNASGLKVGTYARGALGIFGVSTLNPAAIAAAVLSNPTIAVQLLRAYGAALHLSTGTVNTLIKEVQKSLNSEPNVGLSIKDVSNQGSKIDSLIQEARKYKSAEEFVKGQGVITDGIRHLDPNQYGNFTDFVRDIEKLNYGNSQPVREIETAKKLWGDRPFKGAVQNMDVSSISLAEKPLTVKPKAGRLITEPIEVQIIDGRPTLVDGRHRLDQAIANGDKTIPAKIEGKSRLSQLIDLWKKANKTPEN